MERQDILRSDETLAVEIEQETQRLQQMRDTDTLEDPSTLPVYQVDAKEVVTPQDVDMSYKTIIRNAALKAVGDCSNYGDETGAKANIAKASGKTYETNVKPLEGKPEVKGKTKATK